jgi:2',3'-cyclic-nucleotide 2'-phosphodiesterase/3'-nucleotidase
MVWDKRWLDGKLATLDTLAAAQKYIPQMRKAGADLIVVVSHGGLDASAYQTGMENANYHLLRDVPGIDALLMGHSHQVFPDANSKAPGFNAAGVDKVAGTVHGVPAVMAGFWGKHLGVIQLTLQHDGKRWQVDSSATRVEARSTTNKEGQFVQADSTIAKLIATENQQAKDYVRTAIGSSDFAMSSYFADLGDVSAVQTVNMAQADFVARYVKNNLPALAELPVLSMAAAFKNGFAGTADYTDIAAGSMAINHAADLYPYANTIHAVQISGDGLKAWLETSAKRFNQIDPQLSTPQELISRFPGYNFDILTSLDIHYEIDVSQPIGNRIRQLSFKGKPVDASMRFIVATNNYRASGGGGFPGLDGSNTVMASTENNRDVVVDFVKRSKRLTLQTHGSARSWNFTSIKTNGLVVFHAPPGKGDIATAAGLNPVEEIQADDGSGRGMALYQVQLAR